MTKLTKEEYIQWCKDRAMEYVNREDLTNAVRSMLSDMNKGEDTALSGPLGILGVATLNAAANGNKQAVIDFIQGCS